MDKSKFFSTNLSPREKRLIIIFFITAFVMLSIQYLIIPRYSMYRERIETNESLLAAYHLVTDYGGAKTEIEQKYNKVQNYIDNATNIRVMRHLSDEELNRYFTDLSVRNNLKPISFIIEHESTKTLSGTKTVDVTLTTEGGMDLFINMLAEVDNINFLMVREMDAVAGENGFTHTIKIGVFMLAGE